MFGWVFTQRLVIQLSHWWKLSVLTGVLQYRDAKTIEQTVVELERRKQVKCVIFEF